MSVVIRRINPTPEDVARYRTCRLEMLADAPIAFTDSYAAAGARPDSYWVRRVQHGAARNDQLLLVAEAGGAFVGSFTAVMHERGDCWIYGVWVHAQHRSAGVAKRLLDETRRWACDAGATRLMLHVNSTNDRARRFYEREGFELTGEKHPHAGFPHTDELEMRCPLDR